MKTRRQKLMFEGKWENKTMMGFALAASGAMLETKRCILRANRKQ